MNYFENIIGYEHIKLELSKIIDCINNRDKYEKLGVKIPKNLLLHGQPGLGKTLFANAFIKALNRNKYIIRKNMPDGQFVNEINRIITEAMNNQPSVILLDDIDKFSNGDDKHRNTDEFVVVQSFIDDCKDLDVYFIATANDLEDMPSSLLRAGRFSNRIEFEAPRLEDAVLIIKHYLSEKCVDNDVDYEEIARILEGRSCALLESILNEAGIYAGFNNQDKISMSDIIKASLRIIYNAPEDLGDKTEFELKCAAYHEAGHTLISELLELGSVNLVTVANYFGNKGGLTAHTPDKDYWSDISKMENRVKMLLAGKAATEIIFNKVDVGCSSDLSRAKSILDRFYDDYGMDSFNFSMYRGSSEGLYNKERWITSKLVEFYDETKKLLFDNKDLLIKIANELINKKTITRTDIKALLS